MKASRLAACLLALTILACASGRRSSKDYRATYRVTGKGLASLTYRNESGGTEQREVGLPWSKSFNVRGGEFLYISAQKKGGFDSITADIEIDGETRKTSTSEGEFVIASSSYNCCN